MKYKLFIVGLILLLSCSNQNLTTKEDKGQKVIVELRELIKTEIKDPERQAQILQIVDGVEIESQKFFKFYQDHDKNISQLHIAYETSRENLEKVIDEFNKKYDAYLKMLIRKRSEMRQLTSIEEWETIMDRESTFIPE
jgi:hypothetical protein